MLTVYFLISSVSLSVDTACAVLVPLSSIHFNHLALIIRSHLCFHSNFYNPPLPSFFTILALFSTFYISLSYIHFYFLFFSFTFLSLLCCIIYGVLFSLSSSLCLVFSPGICSVFLTNSLTFIIISLPTSFCLNLSSFHLLIVRALLIILTHHSHCHLRSQQTTSMFTIVLHDFM